MDGWGRFIYIIAMISTAIFLSVYNNILVFIDVE